MRPDLTDNLIHFIRGESDETVYWKLRQILYEQRLRGGIGFIKGGYRCVCFAELSVALLRHGFVNKGGGTRYSRCGIVVPKAWLFELGGRPVIYQTDKEFDDLPESYRWRHVRFDPSNGVDFTWEREWRIPIDELIFDNSIAEVIVPDREWAERLRQDHAHDQDRCVAQYSLVLDDQLAEMFRKEFAWTLRHSRG